MENNLFPAPRPVANSPAIPEEKGSVPTPHLEALHGARKDQTPLAKNESIQQFCAEFKRVFGRIKYCCTFITPAEPHSTR